MYLRKINENHDQEEVRHFIKSNSFGILVSNYEGRPWATHIPLELELDIDNNEVIYGHIAKSNPQWKEIDDAQEVMIIYNGPHTYISSSLYDHENVPTWNYIAVHVYGTLKKLSYDETIFSLKKLVDKYESKSKNPVKVEEMSEKTLSQINGIFPFKIEITEIQAKKKLSQNRDDKNFVAITNHLDSSKEKSDLDIAEEMKKIRSTLFDRK